MVGITRFNITDKWSGKGTWRIDESRKYWAVANGLYRQIFTELNISLLEGEEIIDCTMQDFTAGYDYQLGIDLILRSYGQGEMTIQEKFLFTNFKTVTIEHCQDWLSLEPGDWFKLKANYYFVGYDTDKSLRFTPWVLLDWSRLQRATAQGRIKWRLRDNDKNKDGARSSFMFLNFDNLPPDVVVSSSEHGYSLFY